MSQLPAVVLLHSSASSARQWLALTETLEGRYRVFAVDFHGHGARPEWSAASPLTLADDAAIAAALLVEVGAAHVVGHSYGAAVALKLATLQPTRVRSLVAYEPVLFGLLVDDVGSRAQAQEILALADFIREQLAAGDAAAAARRFIEFWSGAGSWDVLSAAAQQAASTRMRSVLRHFDALFGDPLKTGQLARLRMPMLLLTGADTVAVTRRVATLLREALVAARHEVLPGMGHLGPMTHAPVFNRRVAQFLNAIETPTASRAPLNPGRQARKTEAVATPQ